MTDTTAHEEHPPGGGFSPAALPRMSPGHQLMFFPVAAAAGRAVWALAKLGVADQLTDGPRSPAELAREVGADPDALARVLRAAAALGVFREVPDGRFALTPPAELLRSDLPESRRDAVILQGEDLHLLPYRDILYTLRTGEPSFERVYPLSYAQHLQVDDAAATLVRLAGASAHRGDLGYLTSLVDLSPFPRVAELRGDGLFLSALLREHPHCLGTVTDRPEALPAVRAALAAEGAPDRVGTVPADPFGPLPAGIPAYLLKQVLRLHQDADALRVLGAVREALGTADGRRLFVLERVVGGSRPDLAAVVDLEMLLLTGGRERTGDQWRALLHAGGFEVLAAPATGAWTAFECRPR
ncbi:methyltransferase [Streptomyces sp. NPDC001985]|uniref:methyltransferase n=1 Tax=Streptomyces sp. NPDC001985 TaxID=3154406 RepID=UPI00331A9EF9